MSTITIKGVRCPKCHGKTRTLRTRAVSSGRTVRRRMCRDCGNRFTTDEKTRADKE